MSPRGKQSMGAAVKMERLTLQYFLRRNLYQEEMK